MTMATRLSSCPDKDTFVCTLYQVDYRKVRFPDQLSIILQIAAERARAFF